jgi:hypothetical protein
MAAVPRRRADITVATVSHVFQSASGAPERGQVIFRPLTAAVDETPEVHTVTTKTVAAALDATGSFTATVTDSDDAGWRLDEATVAAGGMPYTVTIDTQGLRATFTAYIPTGAWDLMDLIALGAPPDVATVPGGGGGGGTTIYDGTGRPANDLGEPGDYYLQTSEYVLFGPKLAVNTIPQPEVSLMPDSPGTFTGYLTGLRSFAIELEFPQGGTLTGFRYFRSNNPSSQPNSYYSFWTLGGELLKTGSTKDETQFGWQVDTLLGSLQVEPGERLLVALDGMTDTQTVSYGAEIPGYTNGPIVGIAAWESAGIGGFPDIPRDPSLALPLIDVILRPPPGPWPTALVGDPSADLTDGGSIAGDLVVIGASEFTGPFLAKSAGGTVILNASGADSYINLMHQSSMAQINVTGAGMVSISSGSIGASPIIRILSDAPVQIMDRMGSAPQRVIVADPQQANEAASKSYVDAAIAAALGAPLT